MRDTPVFLLRSARGSWLRVRFDEEVKAVFPFRPFGVLKDKIRIGADGEKLVAPVFTAPRCLVPDSLVLPPQKKFLGTVLGFGENLRVDVCDDKRMRAADGLSSFPLRRRRTMLSGARPCSIRTGTPSAPNCQIPFAGRAVMRER